MLSPSDLILSAPTVATDDFEERVRAAAAAGFAGIGLSVPLYDSIRAAGASETEMSAVLRHYGVECAELLSLSGWAGDTVEMTRSRALEDRLYAISDAFGARYMVVGSTRLGHSPEDVAARFAAVCDRAAAHGLVVGLEFLPWTEIADAASAWGIVELAGRSNAGILVDAWHMYNGPTDASQLRAIPGERIVAVHFDDADAMSTGDLHQDALRRRRLPGEGVLPLVEFVRTLDSLGVAVPYSVEILSDELNAVRAHEAARLAGDAARAVLAAARPQPRLDNDHGRPPRSPVPRC